MKFRYTLYCLFFTGLNVFVSCGKGHAPLDTVKEVNLARYAGTWYEIARLPNRFERGLICVNATYRIMDDGRIRVINRGRPEKDLSRLKEARGVAWVPDEKNKGRLKVSFFWPFSGNYWIMKLDSSGYRYALVGDPSREYLWILARETSIDKKLYDELTRHAKERGFDISKLYRTPQGCGKTPVP